MKQVTISRTEWQRGGADQVRKLFPDIKYTSLWNSLYTCGCCLGHFLHQACGFEYPELEGRGEPNELAKETPLTSFEYSEYEEDEVYVSNDFAEEAMAINDDYDITDAEREEKLIELFAKNGYELEFVD